MLKIDIFWINKFHKIEDIVYKQLQFWKIIQIVLI